MKKSQLIILALVLLALAAGVFLKTQRERPELARELYTSLDFDFTEQEIDRIELGKGGTQTLKLERKDGVWRIPSLWNARADQAKVDRLLNAASDLKGDLRSDSKELFADYGIAKETAYSLALFKGGEEAARLAVGDKVPSPDTNFVRKENSAAVFLSDMAVLPAMGIAHNEKGEAPQAAYWADLDFFDQESSAVTSIEILRQGKEGREAGVKLVRMPLPATAPEAAGMLGQPIKTKQLKPQYSWSFAGQEPYMEVDQQEVEAILLTLENGRATAVADPGQEPDTDVKSVRGVPEQEAPGQNYGASGKGWTLRLGLEAPGEKDAASEVVLDLVSTGEGAAEKYYLKAQGGDTVYELTPYTAAQLTKTLKDFWKDNPFDIDPEQVQGILLKQGDKELFLDRAEDKKERFEKILDVLANVEYRSSLWQEPLPKDGANLPNRIEVRQLNGEMQTYLAGVIEHEKKKVFLLQPEGSARLFTLDEPSFEALSKI